MTAKSGVLVVDKPKGPTSHDVVARLRRLLGTRQVGHCGTLDPMATGVLVVAIGEATKLVPWLTSDDKSYEATLRLGIATDTLDAEGAETERRPLDPDLAQALRDVSAGRVPARLAAALDAERRRAEQVPPAYSAIKVDGTRAHELARRGEAPELAARAVEVKRLDVTASEGEALTLSLEVTKGYFVRSLARDLAAALGTVGHLTALRRTRSGAFTLADAMALDAGKDALAAAVIPLATAATRALPASTLTEAGALAASHGQRVHAADLADPHMAPSAWLDATGRLVAVGQAAEDGTGQVLRGFPLVA
jgi:tRNA pseudouridine55 synthase